MARIRTIKPTFFTSEDIVSLTPLARLFFVSLWCEADREGRLVWKKMTLKLRYLPADDCDIEELAEELIEQGLIVLYEVDDKTYCWIPGFKKHQVINNRETESTLPEYSEGSRVNDACTRVKAEGKEGREGKGKEGKEEKREVRASRLPRDWGLSDDLLAWTMRERIDLNINDELAKFRDYWSAKPGKDGRKLDWDATWRNWVRNAKGGVKTGKPSAHSDFNKFDYSAGIDADGRF